ncbi:hypothetical protein CR513_44760, partial [Mucuna pruriens]
MQVLNLVKEFELQKIKEFETIKEYLDKLLGIANKVRLLGTNFADSKIVQKILVTILERYETSITFLEDTKDLSKITLVEAQEQWRLMRQNYTIEGALLTKSQETGTSKRKSYNETLPTSSKNATNNYNKGKGKKKNYPPCRYCGRTDENAQEEEEDQLFVATCSNNNTWESWLIDSGCINHMTYDKGLFKQLERTKVKWVKIGNGEQIPVKGKGTTIITSYLGTKILIDILYVHEIDQNMLSVG